MLIIIDDKRRMVHIAEFGPEQAQAISDVVGKPITYAFGMSNVFSMSWRYCCVFSARAIGFAEASRKQAGSLLQIMEGLNKAFCTIEQKP